MGFLHSRGKALPQLMVFSRQKFTLAFKHDPKKQALVFYTRDPPREEKPLALEWAFNDLYLDLTGKGGMPKVKHRNRLVPDCRRMKTWAVVSVLEEMGRMPRRREFTVCAISRLFFRNRAFTVGFPDQAPSHVRLKPGLLFSRLVEEELELEGKMDLEGYRRLKRMVVENCYVRHGIEVDVRLAPGMGEKRYVVFPRKINGREITRCLAMAGIRMRLMRLRILRPTSKADRIPTRCIVFPAGKRRKEAIEKAIAITRNHTVPEEDRNT